MTGWDYKMYLSHEEIILFEKNFLLVRGNWLSDYYNNEFDGGYSFIAQSFPWERTEEGYGYWRGVALRVLKNSLEGKWVKNKSYGKKIMV